MSDRFFSGPGRPNRVNLSTNAASSSSSLLETVRAERTQREQRVRQDRAARSIQRVWRTYSEDQAIKRRLLDRYDDLVQPAVGSRSIREVERQARAVMVLSGWKGVEARRRVRRLMNGLIRSGSEVDPDSGLIKLMAPLRRDADFIWILAVLCIRILDYVKMDPTSQEAAEALTLLQTILDSAAYSSINHSLSGKADLVACLGRNGWTDTLVLIVEGLIALNRPKKKQPHLHPVVKLLVAPFVLSKAAAEASMIPPLLNRFLAIPALLSSLPIPTITHLSADLPIFTILLPHAASHPRVLHQGALETEYGKTYFLANLATFGITGGLLARHGPAAGVAWARVLGEVLGSVDEGWGRWAEGILDEVEEDVRMTADPADSDEEMEAPPKSAAVPMTRSISGVPTVPKRARQTRPLLPANIASKLTALTTPAHLSFLQDSILSSQAGPAGIRNFGVFALQLLVAFRGTPRWEGILDGIMAGQNGRVLMTRMWRETIRGKWRNSADKAAWETFGSNPWSPSLLLLTQMYNHYLLVTPDDEFFSRTGNPLSLDEVVEVSALWRDLAFWGYMTGVDQVGGPRRKLGNEEERALFTRAVTRVAERNARQQFAPEDHWAMPTLIDQAAFIEAAVLDDANLLGSSEGEVEENDLQRQARVRQRLSKRQVAYLSPRLGLLNNLPMSVPFTTRLAVFRQFVEADKLRLKLDSRIHHQGSRFYNTATIKREHLAEDGFRQLNDLGEFLKGRVYITFIDKYGQEESGVDGGGLFKEFMTELVKTVFDTERGLWLANTENELYPNPHAYSYESNQLSWYAFIGRILGKALYEGILVDATFAGFFLAKWLGRESYLDDLKSLDKELYRGLTILKNYPKPEELALNFTITQDNYGEMTTSDLIPGGSEIAVTAENRHEYIQLVCKYKLDRQIALQSRAFFSGLSEIIDPKWLRMFDQMELQQLIGGEETPIDIDDLKVHTITSGFPNDTMVQMFWNVVRRFNQDERRNLLQFVTSCGRPPLLGFAHLYPKFCIRFGGMSDSRLPSASSCFNLLKLPGYPNESILRTKLLQAINSGAGFDLS